jgi:hypothetical protein
MPSLDSEPRLFSRRDNSLGDASCQKLAELTSWALGRACMLFAGALRPGTPRKIYERIHRCVVVMHHECQWCFAFSASPQSQILGKPTSASPNGKSLALQILTLTSCCTHFGHRWRYVYENIFRFGYDHSQILTLILML